MRFKEKRVFVLILTLLIGTGVAFRCEVSFADAIALSNGQSITVDDDLYLGGEFLEVGIDFNGWFGASEGAPTGFHPYMGQRNNIGMIVDSDGFDKGLIPLNGDFSLPGGPVEGYGIGYRESAGGMPIRRVNINPLLDDIFRQNMSLVDLSSGNTLSAIHTVDDGKVKLEQKMSFEKGDKFLKMEVTITNISVQKLYDVRYFRKLDPDQDSDFNGTYTTINKVEENPTSGNKALVYAKGPLTGTPFFYLSFDPKARASVGASSDPFSPNMYNANGDALLTSEFNGDTQIALTFAEGDLNSGESVTMIFYQSLDSNMSSSLKDIEEQAVVEPKLIGLTIENGLLRPSFTNEISNYHITLPVNTEKIKVTPIATSGASILVNGIPVMSGTSSEDIPLKAGENIISIRIMKDLMIRDYVIKALVASNDLSSLTLETGVLSPQFQTGIHHYTVNYPASTSSASITAVSVTSGASVKIEDVQVVRGLPVRIGLSSGVNTIPIKITAEDGAIKTYTITTIVAKSSLESGYLSELDLDSGILTPYFDKNRFDYSVDYPEATSSMTIRVVPLEPDSMVKINHVLMTGSVIKVPLSVGENIIPIEVIGLNNTTKTYTLTASVAKPPVEPDYLSYLGVSSNNLSPSFNPKTFNYEVRYPVATTSMMVTAKSMASGSIIRINNGVAVGSSVKVPLAIGENRIPVEIINSDGAIRMYTIKAIVDKPIAGSSYLSDLSLKSGHLSPDFDPRLLNYSVDYPASTTSMSVKAVPVSGAYVSVNGWYATSSSAVNVSLKTGTNFIPVWVWGTDNTTRTYTIQANVAEPEIGSSYLSSLTLDSGWISPNFSSNKMNYSVYYPSTTTSMGIKAIPVTTGAAIQVGDYQATSVSAVRVSLKTGANRIPIKVKTPYDIERIYTITAWVAPPPMAEHYLSNLTLDSGVLSPSFSPSTLNYYVTYSSATTSMGIKAVSTTTGGYIIVNNGLATSGSSVKVSLKTGVNVIPVRVVAPDYSTLTYTITATVLEAPIISSDLLSLKLSSGTLLSAFDANKLNYFVRYAEGTTSMGITAVAVATGSSVSVNNVVTTSDSSVTIALNSGPNLIPIKVTATDQSTKTYTITAIVESTKIGSSGLSDLILGSGNLSPVFSPNHLNYEVYYPKSTKRMIIKPVATDLKSSIIVNQVVTAQNSSITLSLATGTNIIPIKVVKEDGTETTYTITAVVAE